jgi:large subunit ribosomal protein L29
MKLNEMRALSDDELVGRLSDAKEELMRLRFQQATGELTDTSRLKYARRTIARLHTVLRERELMEQE